MKAFNGSEYKVTIPYNSNKIEYLAVDMYDAIDWIKNHPDQFYQLNAEWSELTQDEIAAINAGYSEALDYLHG